MSATGLEVFDRSLQATHIWLGEIGEVIGPDKQRCYHALRAVLQTLRDRLTTDQAAHLGAQLPLLVRGIYYEGYRPSIQPLTVRSLDEFIALVQKRIGDMPPMDAVDCTRAVFQVLDRHIAPGEMDDVKQALPQEIRRLFGAGADGQGTMQGSPAARREQAERGAGAQQRG
ncbi:DUF2267 domain-containing protein [Rhodoligotrophos defluvii]|uniref:DUF2267 domain-containing protein n=1 Tax=Rhodoligotrophos defluvii TaxID=2561934 RepID=UPI0010C960D4|nr:DUF2267 domain-containing protein [Rhodoligotrophos defluvii]